MLGRCNLWLLALGCGTLLTSCHDDTSVIIPPTTTTTISSPTAGPTSPVGPATTSVQSLSEARSGFQTVIVRDEGPAGPPDVPPSDMFLLTTYTSPVGELAAYVTPDPADGERHPAIIWITGGDCNTIGDVWSPSDPSNDQSARAFRERGIVMMFPSLRGGNDNPGQREGFFGEVDDVLAAADHLENLPYVNPERIYLGGHSTGGTLVLLVAACSDRFAAVFSFGPVAAVMNYGGEFYYSDPTNVRETSLRDPVRWLSSIQSPVYVFEGMIDGNWPVIGMMKGANRNPLVQFYSLPRHDHFSVLHPMTHYLAEQLQQGTLQIDQLTLNGL